MIRYVKNQKDSKSDLLGFSEHLTGNNESQ